jgi:hypothetical protein
LLQSANSSLNSFIAKRGWLFPHQRIFGVFLKWFIAHHKFPQSFQMFGSSDDSINFKPAIGIADCITTVVLYHLLHIHFSPTGWCGGIKSL